MLRQMPSEGERRCCGMLWPMGWIRVRASLGVVVLLAMLGHGHRVVAGATVISDLRVKDLDVTPFLGRGYSIATNTFQSACLADVELTEPSFNFSYEYEDMDQMKQVSQSSSGTGSAKAIGLWSTATSWPRIRAAAKRSGSYGRVWAVNEMASFEQSMNLLKSMGGADAQAVGGKVSSDSFDASASTGPTRNQVFSARTSQKKSSFKQSSSESTKKKIMLATLKTFTYYASVDESRTDLAEAAENMLQKGDYPGFFAACGPYYVRGITRISEFASMLIWKRSNTSEEDTNFSSSIETATRGWGSGMSSYSESSKTSKQQVDTFMRQTQEKQLMIKTRAWGLDKNARGQQTLIATSIPTFRQAIKGAFSSMQNPVAGMIHSMEVVPWVENVEFQNNSELRGEDILDGVEVPLYKKKDILIRNAEFMTTLWDIARAKLTNFYKASVCEMAFRSKFYRNNTLDKASKEKALFNNRTNSIDKVPYLVSDLDKEIKTVKRELLAAYRKFMYTGESSVERCVRDLLKDPMARMLGVGAQRSARVAGVSSVAGLVQSQQTTEKVGALGRGLYLKNYFEHKSCQKIQEEAIIGAIMPENIDDHCMPKLPGEKRFDGI